MNPKTRLLHKFYWKWCFGESLFIVPNHYAKAIFCENFRSKNLSQMCNLEAIVLANLFVTMQTTFMEMIGYHGKHLNHSWASVSLNPPPLNFRFA